MARGTSATNYWLGLSVAVGLFMALTTMLDFPWIWLVLGATMLFLVLQAIYYGQFGRGVLQDVNYGKSSSAAAMPFLFPVSILIRGSDIAVWAGPLLGLVGFAVSYLCLKKAGYFYRPIGERLQDER
ncbi:hypothetical protein ACIPY2_18600 [Paenarthrobacter sp. NPDC089675]|uniref:hypothetical protein n=1 Tax=Paenarthrobacter sp. NPDC089675 TaxID=3364376 RepID=UPI00380FBA83